MLLLLALLLLPGCAQRLRNQFHARNARLDTTLENNHLEAFSATDTQDLSTSLDSVFKSLGSPEDVTPPRPDGGPTNNDPKSSRRKKSSHRFGALALDGQAPAAIQLSLADAQAAALEGNLDLIVANFDPDRATQQIYAEIGRFEATFEGALNYDRNDPPPGNFGLGTPPDQGVDRFEPAIKLPFTTGGSLTLRNGASRFSLPGTQFPNIHDLAPTLNYTQPLLRNAGVFLNTSQVRLAELQQGRVDAVTKLVAISVVAQTEIAYWNLFGAQVNLEIARQQVEFAERQAIGAQRLRDAGTTTDVDVWRADSGTQARRTALVQAETAVLLATRALKLLLQIPEIPVDSPTEIQLTSTPNLTGLKFDRNTLAGKAMSNRLELVDLALQIDQNMINIEVARNGRLPELNFVFEGKLLGTGNTVGQASRQAWGENYNQWFTGLTFSLPLAGNQSARARIRQASINLAQSHASLRRQEVEIMRQINDAADRFEKGWEQILVAQQSVEAAEKTYQGELKLYAQGQRTSDLVLLAADSLRTAQQQLIAAIVNFQQSRVDVAVATGTVLGYSGIQLSGPEDSLVPAPAPPAVLPAPAPPRN